MADIQKEGVLLFQGKQHAFAKNSMKNLGA
jgi:hypothetical protein